ncbi:MAG: protein kinase domain-containing protein, partial [Solirubrobacteraceae bacterium]
LPLHDSAEITTENGDTFLYYVAPFIAGESLRSRLQRGPVLALDEVLRLGREIAHALDYAHRQGVVHLDVKPENILLQEGHAIIADFGIAHAMSDATSVVISGEMAVMGTPTYMSPEQMRGAPDVDGRSDIYSLGCVLNEMMGGRPSSWPIVDVIVRARSQDREQRFQTAGELAAALTVLPPPAPQSGAWRRIALVAALLLVATGPAAVVWARSHSRLDEDLIAVAPFDVPTPALRLWREGLVDVLSRNLDGVGPLRTVPATVAVKQWKGRVDASSAHDFGVRTGARWVIFGGLLGGGDSARATAVLLDAQTGQTVAEVEQRDLQDRVDRISDSLTVAVIRELGHARHLDIARATSAPTASLTALKAYLQGEQFYRAAQWDSAQKHFERALALDSSFALAYHRVAAVRRWSDAAGEVPDTL